MYIKNFKLFEATEWDNIVKYGSKIPKYAKDIQDYEEKLNNLNEEEFLKKVRTVAEEVLEDSKVFYSRFFTLVRNKGLDVAKEKFKQADPFYLKLKEKNDTRDQKVSIKQLISLNTPTAKRLNRLLVSDNRIFIKTKKLFEELDIPFFDTLRNEYKKTTELGKLEKYGNQSYNFINILDDNIDNDGDIVQLDNLIKKSCYQSHTLNPNINPDDHNTLILSNEIELTISYENENRLDTNNWEIIIKLNYYLRISSIANFSLARNPLKKDIIISIPNQNLYDISYQNIVDNINKSFI